MVVRAIFIFYFLRTIYHCFFLFRLFALRNNFTEIYLKLRQNRKMNNENETRDTECPKSDE